MAITIVSSGESAGWNQGVTVSITVTGSNPYLVVGVMPTNSFGYIRYAGVDFPRVESYVVNQPVLCKMCGIIPTSGTNDLQISDTGLSGEQGHLIWVLFNGVSPDKPVGAYIDGTAQGTVSTDITLQYALSYTIEGQFVNSTAFSTGITQNSSQTEQQEIISNPRAMAMATKSHTTTGSQTLSFTGVDTSGPPTMRQVIWEINDLNAVGSGNFIPIL